MKLDQMVDIHCHILPETDDGAVSLAESIAMCEAAAADGIETIVATPHLFDGVHPEHLRPAIEEKIALLQAAVGARPRLLAGAEVRYSYEIFQEAADPRSRIRLNGTSYMLLEFPFQSLPPNLDRTIFQILSAGITPVIAHPERNRQIQQKPELLFDLIGRGALAQLDAGSLTQSFGSAPFAAARRMVEAGAAHFLATDAHHLDRRRPVLSTAALVAAEWAGEEYARALVETNPAALVADRAIPYQLDCDLGILIGKRSPRRWFTFWR
jgi:protein-tyrosine phosphatase